MIYFGRIATVEEECNNKLMSKKYDDKLITHADYTIYINIWYRKLNDLFDKGERLEFLRKTMTKRYGLFKYDLHTGVVNLVKENNNNQNLDAYSYGKIENGFEPGDVYIKIEKDLIKQYSYEETTKQYPNVNKKEVEDLYKKQKKDLKALGCELKRYKGKLFNTYSIRYDNNSFDKVSTFLIDLNIAFQINRGDNTLYVKTSNF